MNEYIEHSDRELEEILALLTQEYEMAKPVFLQHHSEFKKLQACKGEIEDEIRRREDLSLLPVNLGWYRNDSQDFWQLTKDGWQDAWGSADVPGKYDGPFTWIGNEE